MVATRRGARTTSSGKGTPDRSSEVQATPSTPRRSRRAVNQSESRSQQVPPETCCHVEEAQSGSPSRRRCTRASRLHSPEQPSTPIGSTHDGDVSDLESCSSVVSANEALLTRSRRKRTQLQPEIQENDEVSEVESCSSVLSASKNNQSIRRSTRRRAVLNIFDASNADSADGKKEAEHETESELKRVTRSQRRPPPRSSTKPPAEESELSDADSCASSVSGADVSKSASHRITRSRRMICPIPIQLDELTEGSPPPPVTTSRQTKSPRRKAAAVDVTETQSCDSDGYESGPAYPGGPRRSVRTRATASKAVDSESQLFEVHSPVSTRSRATPCSSRTGSSSHNAPTSTQTAVSVEPAEEEDSFNESRLETTVIDDADCTLQEEEKSHVSEEPGECVGTTDVENGDDVTNEVISHDEPPSKRVVCSTEEPAVTSHHQQEEPPAEEKSSEVEKLQENVESSEPAKLCQSVTVTKCEEESEVFEESEEKQEDLHLALEKEEKEEAVNSGPREEEEKMDVSVCGVDVQQQEEEESTEASSSQQEVTEEPDADQHPKQEKTISLLDSTDDEDEEEEDKMEVTVCGADVQQDEEEESTEASSSQREVTEEPDADQHPKQEKTISLLGGTDDEDDEEKMEASVCRADVQQEEEESNQASSSQEDVTEEPDSDQHSKQEKTISLLDSTDDEDDDQEEESGEEEQEVPEEEPQGESSKRSDAASSVGGLFMIDTRPGQEADQQYYKELNQEETTGKEVERQKKKEEEEDEEFVDEEADDDEDEDANVLFSGRIPHLKDLSSRIDPGISVKQLGGLYISFDGSKSKIASLQKQKGKKIQEQLMKKSVIGPDFEKKDAVPPYSESKRALKLKRKTEREKSTGDAWFDMKAPEITQELKGDLQVLKMRGSLDPKRFYKKNDRDGFPKYFQVGTVVDNPVDFYHSRMPKKARKRTMVEELLSDADFRQKNKRKYMDIMAEKAAQSAGKRRFKKNTFNKK